jgi:hypothetical protein
MPWLPVFFVQHPLLRFRVGTLVAVLFHVTQSKPSQFETLKLMVLGVLFLAPTLSLSAEGHLHLARIEQEALKIEASGKYNLKLNLTPELLHKLAANVLRNETGCRPMDIVKWNKNENFPSLGLMHSIWFPPGVNHAYGQSFPEMWQFLRKKALAAGSPPVPAFMQSEKTGAAWAETEFRVPDRETADEIATLKKFLAEPKVLEWQKEFIVRRAQKSFSRVLAAIEPGPKRQEAFSYLKRLLATDRGVISVIDYVNFKGEGLIPVKVDGFTQPISWGFRPVLEKMGKIERDLMDHDPAFKNLSESDRTAKVFARASERALYDVAQAFDSNTEAGRRQALIRYGYLERKEDGSAKGGWADRIDRTYERGDFKPSDCKSLPPLTSPVRTSEAVGAK